MGKLTGSHMVREGLAGGRGIANGKRYAKSLPRIESETRSVTYGMSAGWDGELTTLSCKRDSLAGAWRKKLRISGNMFHFRILQSCLHSSLTERIAYSIALT
jgi:hypothetical protein